MASLSEPIVLRPMRHQGYIQRQQEDWAGITDPKRRKTLQNRLNQRARKQSLSFAARGFHGANWVDKKKDAKDSHPRRQRPQLQTQQK